MILKVSHLVFSSANFDKDRENLSSLGYDCIFTEKNIKNLEIKKPLFTRFDSWHDLSYLTSKDNVSLELLNWRSLNSHSSNFLPFFDAIEEKLLDSIQKKEKDGLTFFEGNLKDFGTPACFLKNKESQFYLNKLLVKTNNLQKSINFWSNFRFTVQQASENQALLRLGSVLPEAEAFYLRLEKTENINLDPHLDDAGVSCISFLSSSVLKEKESLKKKGIKIFDIGELKINNRVLNILFALGPCGELVEVIDFK